MKLTEMTVMDYLDLLKSKEPAPGGGSVSALAGAQGVALFIMVCDLTIGKEKYADYQDACIKAKAKGEGFYKVLSEAVDKDTEAYNMVSAAFKLPKETFEQKKIRVKAIEDATLIATEVPFNVMISAFAAMKTAGSLFDKTNPSAASDLGVSVSNLLCCIKGAWLNVQINLPGVKDYEKVKFFRERGLKISEDAEKMAIDLIDRISKTFIAPAETQNTKGEDKWQKS